MVKARKFLIGFIILGICLGLAVLLIKWDMENHFTEDIGNI
jgi:hypothetical protein